MILKELPSLVLKVNASDSMSKNRFHWFVILISLCLVCDNIFGESDRNASQAQNTTSVDDISPQFAFIVDFPCREGYVRFRGECREEY